MAKKKENGRIKPFLDQCVIYFSREDDCWISHSLKTDQMGDGVSVVDALADMMIGVKNLIALANEDESIEIFQDAPVKIQRLVDKAELLPAEIYEIAHKKVHGEWPSYMPPSKDIPDTRHRQTLKVEIEESVAA